MKIISSKDLFNGIYDMYHARGLTTTPAKLLEQLGLWEDWKIWLKAKLESIKNENN